MTFGTGDDRNGSGLSAGYRVGRVRSHHSVTVSMVVAVVVAGLIALMVFLLGGTSWGSATCVTGFGSAESSGTSLPGQFLESTSIVGSANHLSITWNLQGPVGRIPAGGVVHFLVVASPSRPSDSEALQDEWIFDARGKGTAHGTAWETLVVRPASPTLIGHSLVSHGGAVSANFPLPSSLTHRFWWVSDEWSGLQTSEGSFPITVDGGPSPYANEGCPNPSSHAYGGNQNLPGYPDFLGKDYLEFPK